MPRADRKNITETALIETRVVAAVNTVAQGEPVVLDAAGTISRPLALTDQIYGIAYKTEDGTWPAAAGDSVDVVLIGSPCIVPCRVGSASATVTVGTIVNVDGNFDGVKTITAGVGAVTTPIGMATQLGSVAGELVGVNLGARLGTGA
jgi:hypothetical protein